MSIKYAETALLLAGRTLLRRPLNNGGAGFSDKECQIEADEMAPAVVGDLYVVLMPGGFRPGPRHNTSGGVYDLIYGLDVLVARRTGNVPRDRYLATLEALNAEVDRVITALDFDATNQLLQVANRLIREKTGTQDSFIEPLKFAGVDKRPKPAPGSFFGGTSTKAGIMRGVFFQGARLVTAR